jgi:DNA-binding MarR family transcriptional regulator
MEEKNYLYQHTSRIDTLSSDNKDGNNKSLSLTRFETLILRCIKGSAKTETKISKEVKINLPIVSELVTDLMLKGYIERTRRRRVLFASKEYFSTTLEGLIALEIAQRAKKNRDFLSQVFATLMDKCQKILDEISSDSIFLKLILGVAKFVLRVAKEA